MARPKQKQNPPQQPAAPAPGLSMAWRITLSALITWHLLAVFLSPFSVPPSSEVVTRLAQSKAIRWYTDPLYLNHGYHFFGPEPPVNQLIRYAVLDEGGQVIAEGEFPNLDQQWPRLYYHRHMMLADQSTLAPGSSAEESIRLSLRAYARHLLRTHEGAEARLDCVRHEQLSPFEVQQEEDPNAPERFVAVASVTERAADLDYPLIEPRGAESIAPRGYP